MAVAVVLLRSISEGIGQIQITGTENWRDGGRTPLTPVVQIRPVGWLVWLIAHYRRACVIGTMAGRHMADRKCPLEQVCLI